MSEVLQTGEVPPEAIRIHLPTALVQFELTEKGDGGDIPNDAQGPEGGPKPLPPAL